jgi:hypothetical protein
MLARPDVREIMMRETTLLGLAQFKRHPKQLVFKYVIFHTSRARSAMRSVPRTAQHQVQSLHHNSRDSHVQGKKHGEHILVHRSGVSDGGCTRN